MKINIKLIKETIQKLEIEESEKLALTERLDEATEELRSFASCMNTIQVRGRENLDTFLGCMIAIDMIIGEEEDDG